MIKMPRTHPKTHFTIEDYAVSMQKLFVKKKNVERNAVFRQVALLAALGWGNKQISEDLHLSTGRVSIIKNSPELEPFIKAYREKFVEQSIIKAVQYRLREGFFRGADGLDDLAGSTNEAIKLGASKVLYQTGADYTIPKKTVTEATHKVGVISLTGDDLKRIMGVLDEDADDALEAESTSQEREDE